MRCFASVVFAVLLFGMSNLSGWAQTSSPDGPISCRSDQQRREEDCLVKLKGIASRDGDILRLHLENGKEKTFTTNRKTCEEPDDRECIVFKLVGYYPRRHFFLVQRGYYECAAYDLVSARTGGVLQISTVPEFSPRGMHIISVDANDGCHGPYDLAIWSTASDPPSLEFQHSPKEYEAWEFISWHGEDRINLKVGFSSGQGKERKWLEQEAQAVHAGNEWRLERGRLVDRR